MPGKSIDELNLSDANLLRSPDGTKLADPRETEWYRFVQDIEDLLATGKYTFAEETLRGIQVTCEQTKRVTDGQRRAVRNIEDSKQRNPIAPRGTFARRRYEGWR